MISIYQGGLCVEYIEDDQAIDFIPPAPQPKGPEVCAEVFQTKPVSPEACMDAVRSMCGGSR